MPTMETTTFAQQLAWAERHMRRTQRALAALPDLTGMRLACSMHLDLKMIPFVSGLLARGADLFITTCNPQTVRNEVVAEMQRRGAQVEAWHNMPPEAHQQAIEQALRWEPTHLCEMGADFTVRLAAEKDDLLPAGNIRASLEATGSGINRLHSLTLPYPVFNWDDLPVKEGLHNRHMVGLSTWQTFVNRTQLSLHEKQVLVVGYGSVGRGVAAIARAFGGTVIVADKDPVRQIEARYNGWLVLNLQEALPLADVIVTVTGAKKVIAAQHFPLLRDGVILLNSGHSDDEIDATALRTYPAAQPLPYIESFQVDGKTIYLFAGGAMANLAAGEGDTLNAFDVTLAVLVAGIGYIAREGAQQPAGVHILPHHVWATVL